MSASDGGNEVRISQLIGDRPCASCAFNLYGQTVVREPVYGMLIVRCPECSTVASIQEYPRLGAWANRWAAVLATAWILLLLAALVASVGTLSGLTLGSAERASMGIAVEIAKAHNQYQMEKLAATPQPAVDPASAAAAAAVAGISTQWLVQQGANPWSVIDPQWWAAEGPSVLARARPNMARGLWNAASIFAVGLILSLIGGVCWATILPHVRRRTLLVLALVIPALAAAFALAIGLTQFANANGFGNYAMARDLAGNTYVIPAVAVVAFMGAVGIAIGVLIGRSVTRFAIRALLPPRLRVPFAWLWFCDGLTPPRTRRV